MIITEVLHWKIECFPVEKGAIRSMIIYIEAKTRKEAELMVLTDAHKFFDQDIKYLWSEPIKGYRQMEIKENKK